MIGEITLVKGDGEERRSITAEYDAENRLVQFVKWGEEVFGTLEPVEPEEWAEIVVRSISVGVDNHDRRLAVAMAVAGYPIATLEKALRGHWSDFKTPLTLPKIELVKLFERDNHMELAARAARGDFDG
jgi:hypothetical protein